MTSFVLIAALLTPPDVTPTMETILYTWREREGKFRTGDLSWRVVRDSRTGGLGFSDSAGPARLWRLQFDGTQCRVDGERLTVMGRDFRPRPAEADPDRARLEFRRVLLEQRLEAPQVALRREPFSAVVKAGRPRPKNGFGDLESLLVEGPLWAARPELFVGGNSFTVVRRHALVLGRNCPIVEVGAPGGGIRELWLDPEQGFRVLRMIEKSQGHVVSQLDLDYDAGTPFVPVRWTALRFDAEDNVIEFAVAERTALTENLALEAAVFEPAEAAAISPVGALGANYSLRRLLRGILDSFWLSALLLGTVAFAILFGCGALRRSSPRFSRRVGLSGALVLGTAFVLGSTPLFDPSEAESFAELCAIWDDAQALKDRPDSGSKWNAFSTPALAKLQSLAGELERSHHRRVAQGIWPVLFGRDRPAELVRLELLGVARTDLPAILRQGPSIKAEKEHALAARLGKVKDHFAGVSPYIQPLKPEDAAKALRRAWDDAGKRDKPAIAGLVAADVAVVVGLLVVWRWRRSSKVKTTVETT